MEIKAKKLTDVDLLRKCASFTSGKDSNMSLLTAYRNKHSIIRSQLFLIEMTDIPLFCASQFVRSTQGVNWCQRTKRTDRGGEDFHTVCEAIAQNMERCANDECDWADICERDIKRIKSLPDRFDRHAPTTLCGIMNTEAIMSMSEKRLCSMASKETREIWLKVLNEVSKVDPDLVKFCVKPCISHGGICRESKCCGYNKSETGKLEIENYKKLFEE